MYMYHWIGSYNTYVINGFDQGARHIVVVSGKTPSPLPLTYLNILAIWNSLIKCARTRCVRALTLRYFLYNILFDTKQDRIQVMLRGKLIIERFLCSFAGLQHSFQNNNFLVLLKTFAYYLPTPRN